jgi:circadian clock protein KaiC
MAKRDRGTVMESSPRQKVSNQGNGLRSSDVEPDSLRKVPTGIKGLDEVSGGGLPQGRTTIICGGPGCGKTMLGLEFLVRGAQQFNEPGVLIAFEETPEEMAKNIASLGFDLNKLVAEKKLTR